MSNFALNWIAGHHQFLEGLVVGWAATHPRVIVRAVYQAADRVPGFHEFVKKNGPALHSWLAEGGKELLSQIDATAAEAPAPESHQ